ncbi:DNA-3-methyladenine glycosylase I [Yinghuangia sp. ASG 101]|uniref:DNA-3-methyladenine glycosylase I n=1 Tax=Yinghuangia sp. ASG 101 TaxID=2896848 RepID=UPI001E501E56|nr:DNA-3-methyladenine glycosylase I [Yinghuangia sp. ASG 101]UGQ09477.1 DNA-3-methyladenine glycosylase I [Yinghuangia sp. ASG 101]
MTADAELGTAPGTPADPEPGGTVAGPDGLARCPWGISTPDYVTYHDTEWGVPLHGDDELFERLCLEAFQSGLSWLTILRRRDGFRAAFDGFEIAKVAEYGDEDVTRLLADTRIIRNRAKIVAAVANARVARDLPGGLDTLIWSHAPNPVPPRPAPRTVADVPAVTPESEALAKDLRKKGFKFVGPTTAYAMMQACGLVDDHLAECHARRRPV